MTKTWIKTDYVPEERDYITKGKWYECEPIGSYGVGGYIWDEAGKKRCVCFRSCAYLDDNPWTVYKGDSPPCEAQPNETTKTEEKDMNNNLGIDWSKAPEGTTHYNKDVGLWYKDGAFEVEKFIGGQWKGSIFNSEELENYKFVPRPTDEPKQTTTKEIHQQKIKIGSKVKLKPTSKWNNGRSRNPLGVVGEVTSIMGCLGCLDWVVQWENGTTDSYDSDDLELISFEETPNLSDWKVRHFRVNDKESKGGAITILYREVDECEYEYKLTICNPKDDFNRKEGVKEALKKPTNTIYNVVFDNNDEFALMIYHYLYNNKLRIEVIETINSVVFANF